MKKILIILSIMFCSVAFAHTIEWYVGDNLLSTTTCESGDNITPPTAPAKFGYHFKKWKPEYTQIEYLESTGTQWIDTGFAYNQQFSQKFFSVRMSYSFPVSVLERYGTNTDTMNLAVLGVYSNIICFVPYSWHGGEGTWLRQDKSNGPDGTLFYDVLNRDKKYFVVNIDPTSMTYQATIGVREINGKMTSISYSDKNIYVFKANGNGAANFPLRLYGLSFESDDTLVRDFIPVLDKNDIPCMYDKVEKKFYYNQGTGDFIAGPIINE